MAVPYSTGLPRNFVLKHTCDGRDGYVFFSSIEVTPEGGQPYLRMYPASHFNRYYTIRTDNPVSEWACCRITKTNGTVQREIQWKHTLERLQFQQEYTPVLQVTGFQHFPAWKVRQNFIRITTPVQQPQAPVQPAQHPQKEFSIPAHAVRALLTYAVLQEESCPILDVPIDVDNGAVTSCFHVFEKSAIQQWLDTPTSGQKCPICKQVCKAFRL